MTHDSVWPTFDGWCVEHHIEPWELPAERWLNLIYYFATRNADREGREKFDQEMRRVDAEWIKLRVQKALRERPRAVENGDQTTPVANTEGVHSRSQRERRLPPQPAWYGSRDRATTESLAAKNTLTSRNGRKSR